MCAWRPDLAWPAFSLLTGSVFAIGAVIAIGLAAAGFMIRRLDRRGKKPTVKAFLPSATQRGQVVRRIGATALGALMVGLVTASAADHSGNNTSTSAVTAASTAVVKPVSAQTRASQVASWGYDGGVDLLDRYNAVARGYLDLLQRSRGSVHSSLVRPFCRDFDRLAQDADAYFQVPDSQTQALWRTFIGELRAIGQDCDEAVSQLNGDLLTRVADEVNTAADTVTAVSDQILVSLRIGGE